MSRATNAMAGSEFLISSKAQTISTTKRNTKRRSEEVRAGYSDRININPNRIKMINDMQAFQCSGILNNNLSYASSTPMVNNVAFINKNVKKPVINPRLIDHLYQFRISNDQHQTAPPSPAAAAPNLSPRAPTQLPPPVMVHSTNLQPATPIIQQPVDQAVAMATVGQSSAQPTTTTPTYDSRQYFHFPEPSGVSNNFAAEYRTHPGKVQERGGINCVADHRTHQASARDGINCDPRHLVQSREQSNSLERGGHAMPYHYHQVEGPPACYVVGNKNVTGHLESRNKGNHHRSNHQNDPNFITLIPNSTGPTDLMGHQRTKYNLVNLPVSAGCHLPTSLHSEWKEEYHELTKLKQAENNAGKPPGLKAHHNTNSQTPISQVIPYAQLETLPLSSSPGTSIKNSPILPVAAHSNSLGRKTVPPKSGGRPLGEYRERTGPQGDQVESRQRNNMAASYAETHLTRQMEATRLQGGYSDESHLHTEHLRTDHVYENAMECQVLMRNTRPSRCSDNVKKLSYIKESSMSGESLETKNKLAAAAGEPMKRSIEGDSLNNEEVKLPDIVKEIFPGLDNEEKGTTRHTSRREMSERGVHRKTSNRSSQDSGKPPSGTSTTLSKKHSSGERSRGVAGAGDHVRRHSSERKSKSTQVTQTSEKVLTDVTSSNRRHHERRITRQASLAGRKSDYNEEAPAGASSHRSRSLPREDRYTEESSVTADSSDHVTTRPRRIKKKPGISSSSPSQIEIVKTGEEKNKSSPRLEMLKRSESFVKKTNSPQLEAVRRMDAQKVTGDKTRKYNASVEDEEETATLLFDKNTRTWKLYRGAANNQLFIQEVGRKMPNKVEAGAIIAENTSTQDQTTGESKKPPQIVPEGAKFVVRGDDQPHQPLLDPKAHALTDAECCPMLQPMHHRFLVTSTSNYSFTSPGKSTTLPAAAADDVTADLAPKFVYRIETPESHCDLLEFSSDTNSGQHSEVSVKKFVPIHTDIRNQPTLQPQRIGDQVQLYPNGGLKYDKSGHKSSSARERKDGRNNLQIKDQVYLGDHLVGGQVIANVGVASAEYAMNVGQSAQNHPVISPNHPAFHEDYFRYGDDGSFPRSSPGCDIGCMPCLVAPQSKVLSKGGDGEETQALLAVLPAPPSPQILDPNWHLSSSEDEEGEGEEAGVKGGDVSSVSEGMMEQNDDEDIGLISMRRNSTQSVSMFDTFTNKFMQFLEETKDAEGFLGDAAKFLIEKADETSLDGMESNEESSEEEPYIPQKKRIADDTLLGMIKKEERKKQEKLKSGEPVVSEEMSETDFLIKSQPLKFDKNTILFEVDYQGYEGSSVAKSDKLVNGSATVRNAPPPQFKTLADLAYYRKQEAIQKHAEWERRKAEKLGVSVETLRKNPGMGESPGSASLRSSRGSLQGGSSSRAKK